MSALALVLACLVRSGAPALDVAVFERAPLADGWQQVRAEEGVKVYARAFEGTNIYGLRSDGVADAPVDRVAAVFFDHARAPESVDRMAEERVLRIIDDDD